MSRLEEIKENWKLTGFSDPWDDDISWLIAQAERVQELETTVDFYQNALRDADRRVQELEVWYHSYHKEAKLNNMLKIQNKRYREALEFYADEESYKPFDGIFLSSYQNKVDEDGGEVARKALEGELE